jgi:hypothetical protein
MKFYHATAATNRDSIRQNGLMLEVPSSMLDGEIQRSITGGFFFCTKLPERSEYIDVWEVDTQGLYLQPDDTDVPFDPEDTWWVLYGHPVVAPWRLTLLAHTKECG